MNIDLYFGVSVFLFNELFSTSKSTLQVNVKYFYYYYDFVAEQRV